MFTARIVLEIVAAVAIAFIVWKVVFRAKS